MAHKGACVLHVAQAAKMGKIHWASHLILLHHLPTWQWVFLVLVVYLVEPRQSPALREEHMQSGRLEHLTNQNHNLSLFSHTGPLSEMLLFWNQWHPWGVAAMDESKVRRGFISATFYFLRPHQMSLIPTESVLSAQPTFPKYGLWIYMSITSECIIPGGVHG